MYTSFFTVSFLEETWQTFLHFGFEQARIKLLTYNNGDDTEIQAIMVFNCVSMTDIIQLVWLTIPYSILKALAQNLVQDRKMF